jgi:hypothetical protein
MFWAHFVLILDIFFSRGILRDNGRWNELSSKYSPIYLFYSDRGLGKYLIIYSIA